MDRASLECVKKLNFAGNHKEMDEENSLSSEDQEIKTGGTKLSNLIQRSWSATGFSTTRPENRLETRSKSAQKLHQYDYSEIYKRKREEKARKMEEEIKQQANSFKSRPMPNFLNHRKQSNFPLKITVPITPEVLKRSKATEARKLMKRKFTDWEAKLESAKDFDYEDKEDEHLKPPKIHDNDSLQEPDSTCDLLEE